MPALSVARWRRWIRRRYLACFISC